MKRWLYAGAASLALVIAGLVHGFWTDRWTPDQNVSKAADRLAEVPLQIGEWEGKEMEVSSGPGVPGIGGCVQRSYFNRRLGVTVVMALVNGRPGPVSTHTPEVCYGASGYLVGKREPVPLDTRGDPAQFWTSDAVKTRATEETRLRLYWAWNGGQGWIASADARTEFPLFQYPVLHKLYVLRELGSTPEAIRERDDKQVEPCVLFLNALVPVLEQKLFRHGG
jgi:hypothetical protein